MNYIFLFLKTLFRLFSLLLPRKKWRHSLLDLFDKIKNLYDQYYYKTLSINEDWVVFWDGVNINGLGDNIGPVYDLLKKKKPEWKYFFVAEDKYKYDFLNKIEPQKVVYPETPEFNKLIAKSKYYVGNTCHLTQAKKKGQVWMQLWHGTPLKDIEFTLKEASTWPEELIKNKKQIFNNHQHISKGIKDKERMQKGFCLNSLEKTGYPRNDILFNSDISKKSDLRKKLKIPENKKIILYAPTYRDGSQYTKMPLDIKKMAEHFSDDFVLLLRSHFYSSGFDKKDFSEYKDFLINVSTYPELSELLLITDILIADYSSLITDFTCTRRPMIFYAYDIEKYKKIRGLYFDYEAEMPGPIVFDNEGLIKAINDVEKNKIKYAQKYQEFYDKYCTYEDGHAAERVVDYILEEKHNG